MDPNRSLAKASLAFIGKAIAFTVIFWVVWLYALRPIVYGATDRANDAAQASDDAQRATAARMTQEAQAMQAAYKTQMEESAAMLKRQQTLLDRWEKVIERWEATAPHAK
jgi:F0F1-type ATP synthase membrane subunit b/b'